MSNYTYPLFRPDPNALLTVNGASKIGNAETDTETGGYGMNLVGDLEAHAKAAGVEGEVDLFEVSSQLKPTVTGSSGSLTTKAIARNGGSPLTTTSRFSSSSHTQGQIEGRATADANKAFSSLNVLAEGLPLLTYGTSLTAETDDDAEDVKASTNVRNTQNRPITKAELSSNAQIESNSDKVTVALVMNGEDIDGLGGAASGAAEGAPEASITWSGTSGATPAVVGGQNEAHVQPGINPDVKSMHVLANSSAAGDASTKSIATGEKLRTILVQDQETDNSTFDFGISELILTVASLNTLSFASVEFSLWNDTDNDGDEDTPTGWTANAKFEVVTNPTLGGPMGKVTAGGAWCPDYFLVQPFVSLAIGMPFTATLIPEARLQHANVSPGGSYILVSKYRTEAIGVDAGIGVEWPSSAAVQYDVSRAPHIERATAANLTAYRPMHGAGYAPFTKIAVPNDAAEESATLGPGIRFNPAGNADDPHGEDDLIEVHIKREAGQGDLMLKRSSADLKVYRTPAGLGADEILFDANNQTAPLGLGPGIDQMTVYVEWVGTGPATTADLSVKAPCGPALDTLKFHKFQSVVVGLGGWTEDVITKSGIGGTASDLYAQGYDTFWYPHGDFRDARTEVITALTQRGVQNVAMWGYSLGGNRLHDVAKGVKDAGYGSRIRYTAYVDAIDFATVLTWSERQKPPGSPRHDSFYQRVDVEIRGNSTVEDLEGLSQTTYGSLATAAFATPVTNVDVSDAVATPGFAGAHKRIDEYIKRTGIIAARTEEFVPTR